MSYLENKVENPKNDNLVTNNAQIFRANHIKTFLVNIMKCKKLELKWVIK